MNKITFYTRNTEKPEWLYSRNELFCVGFENVQIDRCDSALASCAGVIRSVLKSDMVLAFATFETCGPGGSVDSGAESFGTAFSTFNKQGQRPTNGQMLYRDILRFSSYPRVGRVAHHWWRGCLDAGDVETDEQIGRFSLVAPTLAEIWRDAESAWNCVAFQNAVIFNDSIDYRVNYCDTAHYTDSHGATRWRRRVQGKLLTAGTAIFQSLEAMFTALEDAHYWQGLEIRIAPGGVQSAIVDAITNAKAVEKLVKAANEAGSDPADENAVEPILRYGIAWEPILEAWRLAAQFVDEGLPELLAAHPTHTESGDEYITRENLEPYTDELSKLLKKLSKTANADWYNPKSYQGQLSGSQARRLPDIIELAF